MTCKNCHENPVWDTLPDGPKPVEPSEFCSRTCENWAYLKTCQKVFRDMDSGEGMTMNGTRIFAKAMLQAIRDLEEHYG